MTAQAEPLAIAAAADRIGIAESEIAAAIAAACAEAERPTARS